MKNGSTCTSCTGPSSLSRLASVVGLPILNEPPGIGTMSNDAAVPGIDCLKGFMSAGTVAVVLVDSAGEVLGAFSSAAENPATASTPAANVQTANFVLRFMLLPNRRRDRPP